MNERANNALQSELEQANQWIDAFFTELSQGIIGQREMLESMLISLLCNGHVLIEGMPGLAKTLTVKAIASILQVSFQRIQFTPDLLPADLIGTMIFNPKESVFQIRKGPIFTNIVLADEINRAPAKVQSALLQAMEEKEATIGSQVYPLPEPFIVMATENPIDQEGTYPLPEAQADRFMMKLLIHYPSPDEEKEILEIDSDTVLAKMRKVMDRDKLAYLKRCADQIYIDDKIKDYAIAIVGATRPGYQTTTYPFHHYIEYGASPRAGIHLIRAARAHALIHGRTFVKPSDIRQIVHRILRHRIILSYEAEAENMDQEKIIDELLESVEVP